LVNFETKKFCFSHQVFLGGGGGVHDILPTVVGYVGSLETVSAKDSRRTAKHKGQKDEKPLLAE